MKIPNALTDLISGQNIVTSIGIAAWPAAAVATQLASKCAEHPVKIAVSLSDIAGGMRDSGYLADPRFMDTLRHATSVQQAIDMGKPVGDCEDKAGHSIVRAMKSNLVKNAWLGSVQWRTNAASSGHAVALLEDPAGQHWMINGHVLHPLSNPKSWVEKVIGLGTLQRACRFQVLRRLPDDTLVFGLGEWVTA